MESVQHIKTYQYFDVPEEDFDKFQEVFAQYEPKSEEDAVFLIEDEIDLMDLSRKYDSDEIKSIFILDCEYSGKDVEMAKDKVAPFSIRRDAIDEIKNFIKKGTPISKKSAKTILKVMEAFES